MKFLIVAMLLVIITVTVADAQRQHTTYGLGLRSCGSWLKSNDTDLNKQAERIALTSWVQGFITAADIYTERGLRSTDHAAIEVWLDQYCTANPLTPLSLASLALVVDLLQPVP